MKYNANYFAKITLAISYENVYVDKLRIITDNKSKAENSHWTHKESGKIFIGSAMGFSKRLKTNTKYFLYLVKNTF